MNFNKLSSNEQKIISEFLAKFSQNELLLQKAIYIAFKDKIEGGIALKELSKEAFAFLLPNEKSHKTAYYLRCLEKVFDKKTIEANFEQAGKDTAVLVKFSNFTEFKKSECCSEKQAIQWKELGKREKTTNTYHDPRYYLISKCCEKLLISQNRGVENKKKKEIGDLIAEFRKKLDNKISSKDYEIGEVISEIEKLREYFKSQSLNH